MRVRNSVPGNLDEATKTKVLLDNDICSAPCKPRCLPKKAKRRTVDCVHDESDLSRVRCTGKVCVDLLGLLLIKRNETVQDVVTSRAIVRAPCRIRQFSWPHIHCVKAVFTFVVREVVLHWAHWELLFEPIDLVEKQDDRGLDEPSGVADRVKERQSLLHPVHGLVFEEKLVVFRNSDQEEYRGHILEAMNPFLPLGPLSTNIKHAVGEIADNECGFGDAGGLDTRSENVLVVRDVVRLGNALNGIEVTEFY